jgi:predicted permease
MSWRRFFERQRRDEEFARELEAHLAHEVDELVARGLTSDEARAAAARKLGNRTRLREAGYERNSLLSLEALWKDLRYGLRQLRRQPLFTTVAVLSLGLGIGASTAIFSLLDQSIVRTLPVPRPHEIVFLYHPGPQEGGGSSDDDEPGSSFSYPVMRALEASPEGFTALAGARPIDIRVTVGGNAERLRAERVSGSYFTVLELRPTIGRLLTPEDDRTAGGHPVVVLAHHYWASRFGSDPAVLGRTLVLNDCPMTVIGVGPRGFVGQGRGRAVDLFVPFAMNGEIDTEWTQKHGFGRLFHWIPIMARLAPGVTVEQAAAAILVPYRAEVEKDLALATLSAERQAEFRAKRILLKTGAYGRGALGELAHRQLYLAQGAALLLVLLACANVAGVQVGRAVARGRETFVRLALGASRLALVRQLLVESSLIALLGGGLGLLMALWSFPLLRATLPNAPFGTLATLDGRVLVFTVALAFLTVLLFGLYPALQSSRRDLAVGIKDQSGQASAAPSVGRFRLALATMQVAVSLMLLVCAGLFVHTVLNLGRMDLGLHVDGLFSFGVQAKGESATKRIPEFIASLKERLAAAPGVHDMTAAKTAVISGVRYGRTVAIEGLQPPRGEDGFSMAYLDVDADYFRTLGMTIVAGRDFHGDDAGRGAHVVVVNETLARRYFPGRDPVGRQLLQPGRVPLDIVGVVRDTKYSRLRDAMEPVFYQLRPIRESGRYLYIRADGSLESVRARLDATAAAIDPEITIRRLKTMRMQVNDAMTEERNLSAVTASFAAAATLLAGLGLYGVLAYNVTRRTREIGIRVALGATAREVHRLLARDIRLLFAAGGALGAVGAVIVGGLIQALLYDVRPWEPSAYVGAALLLGIMGLLASIGPARSATRIDPVIALRHD